ncbi:SIR2 family protein [Bacillus smithii]|uniref:SIR2 family protein n=1 Tax=Bacillus smithii TaxID=1479 RepID=UPI003D1D84D9
MAKISPYYIRGNKNLITLMDGTEYEVDDLDFLNFYEQNDENYLNAIEMIKMRMQKYFMSTNLSIFIGSGCSCSSIPLMGNTFKKIKVELEDKHLLGEYLDENNNNIEKCLDWLVSGLQFLKEDNDKFSSYHALYYTILSKLKESIINLDPTKSELTLRDYCDFLNFIFSLRKGTQFQPLNIFTTNYDLFIEKALEKVKIHFINGFNGVINREFDPSMFRIRYVDDENRYKDKWDPISRFCRLYKLHGSINWFLEDDRIIEKIGYDRTEDKRNTVIYPTVNKHMQSLQTPFSELFREFSLQLQKSNMTLIVMGYGFPDEHINQLMQQALSNETFSLIVLGDIREEGLKNFYIKNHEKQNLHIIGGDTLDGQMVHYFSYLVKNIFELEKVDFDV